MARADEIDEWRNKARRYRELALETNSVITKKMLEALAREADATADDIAENEG